jgi:hypothetical protein
VLDVGGGVADRENADEQTDHGDHGRAGPHDRARRKAGGERAGREGGGGDAEVAGGLVQAEGEAAPAWSREVDLHDHGHRPRKSLVETEQQVGGDDEPPGGRKPDQQRHRQRDQPADHEQPLAADALGEVAGGEVGERLGGAEGDDEGEDRGTRAKAEVLLADQRQHAPLQPDHAPDQRVQADQERELVCVRPQTELDRRHAGTPTLPPRFAATIRSCSSGRGGRSASIASANASSSSASNGLWRRSKPIEENGLAERPRPQTEPP